MRFAVGVITGISICLLAGGCLLTTGPYPADLGGDKIAALPVENFRSRPVVQISFLASADAATETAFLKDYINHPIVGVANPGVDGDDQPPAGTPPPGERANYQTASTNLKAMFVKNTFYAFHLAKFMKMKSRGEIAVILNPQVLKYSSATGYTYEPFERSMPPYDVELNFLSYVHPNSKPSNRGSLITSFGETLAPIVSIRVAPVFNPEVRGAVALTEEIEWAANDSDAKGLRAQLADYINARVYNAGNRFRTLQPDEHARGKSSGAFERGKYFRLPLDTLDLTKKPIPEELLPMADRSPDYRPGTYYAYEFYDTYYRIVMSALATVENNRIATAAQKKYWAEFEPTGAQDIMVNRADRRKRRFIIQAREMEIRYLEDRDENWMTAVLNANDFGRNFNELRNAEQSARSEYIASQARAAMGVLLAVGGVVAGARSRNSAGQIGGIAMAGVGISLVSDAITRMGKIDVVFNSSFGNAYASQKNYVFETAEGERLEVRAKDYVDLKQKLKQYYYERYRRDDVYVPSS